MHTPTNAALDSIQEETCSDQSDQQPKHSRWRQTAILLGAFMINFTTGGLLFGFGVYQATYETMVLQDNTPFTGASPAEIDLIGTLSVSLMTICAPFVLAWAKYSHPEIVVCVGGLCFGLACVLASFGKVIWHFQLSQGLLLGIGVSLSFMPSMTVAPTWFESHRGLAMGFISSGTGIGGLIWAPVIRSCINTMGFRNTLRLTGALGAALICVSGSALRWEPRMACHFQEEALKTSPRTGYVQALFPTWHIINQRKFFAQALGAAFQSAAYYTPVFFIASFAKSLGYTDRDGANFTALSNACNAIGKIAVGFIADRIGRLNSFVLTMLISVAVTLGLWTPSSVLDSEDESYRRALFISFTVLYGVFASAYISLFPPVLVELFGVRELPRVTGIMYMMQGIAALIGTPIAGVLVRGRGSSGGPGGYLYMTILVGGLLFAATLTVVWVRLEVMLDRGGGKWHWKWRM